MPKKERLPLSTLALEIKALTGKPPPTYREGYNAAVDGRIPAERGVNGRWTYAPADLPLIAETLQRWRARRRIAA
jgi:hypothetical protein